MLAPRILIVEDEAVVAMELKSKLTAFGYEVIGTAGYGEDAVETATTQEPDLLLMDIKLAGAMDGIEAARKIHESHDIPVVYLTAHSDEQTLQSAKQGEPFAYLLKPFTESELRTTIEIALHRYQRDLQERNTAEWFSQTVNSLRGAVIGTDGLGRVRHMNPLAEVLTELSESEAIGKKPHEVLTVRQTNSGAGLKDLCVSDCASGPLSRSQDCILVSRSGKEIPVELTVLASESDRKFGRALIFVFREISQRVIPCQDWFSWATNLRISGRLCKSEGYMLEAESFFRRALDIMETHLGGDQNKLAPLLEELSHICGALEKKRDAHLFRLRAERIYSECNANTSFVLNEHKPASSDHAHAGLPSAVAAYQKH